MERRRDAVKYGSNNDNKGNTDHKYQGRMYGIRTLRRRISAEQTKSNPVTGCIKTRLRHHRVRTAFTLLVAVASLSLIYLVVSFKIEFQLKKLISPT